MSRNRSPFVRLRARLDDERGFSLIEAMIAITVIFASLAVLAFTATSGFGYQALARERQSANSIADGLMEDIRGLAYQKIQSGLAPSELAGDPNLVTSCPGDTPQPIYRFRSCAGERIVANGQPDTPPLVPHTGTFSTGYPTPFSYRVYVTNDDPSENPYRVTVIVSWAGGSVGGVAKSVTTQSVFYSPSGCVSNQTHPYAAPCQGFLYAQAQVPRGLVEVTGAVQGLAFQTLSIYASGAEADGQQEQFNSAQAAFMPSGAEIIDGAGLKQTVGAVAGVGAGSDTDPSGTIPTYGSQTLTGGLGGSATLSQGQTAFSVTVPDGDAATAQATSAANAAQVCPPWLPAQNDNATCAGTQIQQGATGSLSATADFRNIYQSVDLGIASLASLGATANDPNRALVDRVLVSGEDGQMSATAARRFGTITLAGLPSGFDTTPFPEFAGWQGYLVSLSGYADGISAAAGTGAPPPLSTPAVGTISYWNGTGYSTAAATAPVTPAPILLSQDVDGRIVELEITAGTLSPPVFTGVSEALTGTPAALGSAEATLTGPINGTISYVIRIDGLTIVDLDIQIELGSMSARGVYSRAPSAG